MELLPTISTYFFPTLMALAIIYYVMQITFYKNATTYSGGDKAEEGIFNGLTIIFIVMVVWFVASLLARFI